MNPKTKTTLIWIFSIIFTLSLAVYQRLTGPTYPAMGHVNVGVQKIKYRLLRSEDSDKDARVRIKNVEEGISGYVKYKKFNIQEEWTKVKLEREGKNLVAYLPAQPLAGKLQYTVVLSKNGKTYEFPDNPVVIRYKGAVPMWVLIPHILLMFLAMLLSTRTGIEALLKRKNTVNLALYTVIFFFFGGMILGPVVQKFAFGEYWTGWPFGGDLTDNKTFVALLAWVIAYWRLRKNPSNRGWAIAAAIILLLVYLIPHSMFGSQLDYQSGVITTGG